MEKRYNVFLEDVGSIEIISKNLRRYKRKINNTMIFEIRKRKEYKRKYQRGLSALNNHKINLIKKTSHIELEELIKILEGVDGLGLQAFSCKVPGKMQPIEKLVLIDKNEENLKFGRIYDSYYSANAPANTRSKIFAIYSKLENSEIEATKLKYIDKASILKTLINYNDDKLFDRFIESYICYLSNIIEDVGC